MRYFAQPALANPELADIPNLADLTEQDIAMLLRARKLAGQMGSATSEANADPETGSRVGQFASPLLDMRAAGVPTPPERTAMFSRDIANLGSAQPPAENPVEQSRGSYGRLAVDPARAGDVLSVVGRAMMAPAKMAGNVEENYRPGAENEIVNQDIGRAGLIAGPGALSVAFGRAAAPALGINGARILQRSDVRRYVEQAVREGKTPARIADDLNTRFEELIGPNETGVTANQVVGYKRQGFNRTRDENGRPLDIQGRGRTDYWRGRYGNDPEELGVMGGQQGPSRIYTEQIEQMLEDMGLASQTKTAKSGTTYVRGYEPGTNPRGGAEVRIPPADNPHGGTPRPWMIDTSTQGTAHPSPSQYNIAGEAYEGNPAAVRQRLEYIFGRQTPRQDLAPPSPIPPDPRQLKLLARGVPVHTDDDERARLIAAMMER